MPANQANVEYWFRLLYECLHGGCYGGTLKLSALTSWISHFWLWIVFIGYILSAAALFVIIYCTMRLFELRKREEEYYSTLLTPPESAGDVNPRWLHIESLAASTNPSDWRTAIIEADVMLDDVLTKQGYQGAGVGEKLKSAESSDFGTLDGAWEAHKVRNQIAHEGQAFALSESLMRRTLSHYEAVFREFRAL